MVDGKDETMKNAKDVLYPIAEEHKKTEAEPDMRFFYAGDNDDDDIVNSLRQFAALPTRNPLVVIVDIPDQKVNCAHICNNCILVTEMP